MCQLLKNGRKWHVFIVFCTVPDAFFNEIRSAQWKLHSGYFALQYTKHPRAHGASRGKLPPCLSCLAQGEGATRKYLKNHFYQTSHRTAHQIAPSPCWSHPNRGAKATTAEQSQRAVPCWDSTAAVGWRGPVLPMEHRTVSFFICSYPPGYFCFRSAPLEFLPHLRNGTINDYYLPYLWWSILEIIVKYLPDYLLSSTYSAPELITPRSTFFSLQEFCFL